MRLATGRPGAPTPPETAPLGPEVLAPGEESAAARRDRRPGRDGGAGDHPACGSAAARGSARTGAAARRAAARIAFELAAAGDVTVRLQQRRRCRGDRCGWRPARSVKRRAPAGRTRWTIGRRLLGMPLRSGVWRLTLATSAGSVQRTFRVR